MVDSSNVSRAISRTLVLILAGGKGSRLNKLTRTRAKPALEFGGQHRIIDFTLSNCINSGFFRLAVITQYRARGLISHLMRHWTQLSTAPNGRLDVLPAFPAGNQEGYTGTADACFKNLDYIRTRAPEYVMLLSGDQVYQMDYRQLLATHIAQQSDVTVSCLQVPVEAAARQLGVAQTDQHARIIGFEEKPPIPPALPERPGACLSSMGIYLFNTPVLCEILCQDAGNPHSSHDFGNDLLPTLISRKRVVAHAFRGLHGEDTPYWRDVGTLDNYWQCHMDLLHAPDRLRLDDPDWPLGGREFSAGTTSFTSSDAGACELRAVQVSSGCELAACTIEHSVMLARCKIAAGCHLSGAVLLPDVSLGTNVYLSRVIVDRGCHIPPGTRLTEPGWARKQGFTVTPKGIIVVTQQDIDALNRDLSATGSTDTSTRPPSHLAARLKSGH